MLSSHSDGPSPTISKSWPDPPLVRLPIVELADTIRQRRMVRTFTDEPLAAPTVDKLLDGARRAPSAGNSQGTSFVVLDTPGSVARYWDVTFPSERRAGFRWPGLFRVPALVVVVCSPAAYVDRYAEDEKASTGLGVGADAWPVPYWFVDAGAVVQNLLLGVTDAGLGACFFGLFEHEASLLASLGVPEGWRGVGTVAIGHPAPDRPGRSQGRPRRALDEVIHRQRW